MTVIATSSPRFSNVVKHEYEPSLAYCREALVVNDAVSTLKVGSCLGSYIASPVVTPGAMVGTGNATGGTASATSTAALQLGTYTVSMLTATTFVVLDPQGESIGTGATTVAFKSNGLVFTITAGGTPAVAGDTLPIVVTGTVKYKLVEATATDGTQVIRAIYIGDAQGNAYDTTLVLNTDTTVLALVRGPAIVSKGALLVGASVNTAGELAAAYEQIEALGIRVATTA